MAGLYRSLNAQSPADTGLTERLVDLTRSAVFLYPNSATVQAQYAVALAEQGDLMDARRVATRALELDELTPHADKKLPDDLKARLQNLAQSASSASSETPAEPAPRTAPTPAPAEAVK